MPAYRTFPCPPPKSAAVAVRSIRRSANAATVHHCLRGRARVTALQLGWPAGGGEHVGEAGESPASTGGMHEKHEAEDGRGIREDQGIAAEVAEQHQRVVGPGRAGAARGTPVLGPEG